jgi:hypothetical protein
VTVPAFTVPALLVTVALRVTLWLLELKLADSFAAVVVVVAITLTVSVLDVAAVPALLCTVSPPPQVDAVLLTDVGEFAGTFTVSVMVLLPPAAMPGVPVQVTVDVPVQLKRLLVEVNELSV